MDLVWLILFCLFGFIIILGEKEHEVGQGGRWGRSGTRQEREKNIINYIVWKTQIIKKEYVWTKNKENPFSPYVHAQVYKRTQ